MGLAGHPRTATAVTAAAGAESRPALPYLTDYIENNQCNDNRQTAANDNGSHDSPSFFRKSAYKNGLSFPHQWTALLKDAWIDRRH